jgi:AhpD family alkylhydroperoxidase
MQERITRTQVYKLQPALVNSLVSLGNAAASVIEASLIHLVKVRASQINGCAFCQHMHAAEARHDGEKQERLDVLAAWHEVQVFSERERAALHWTEALTRIADKGVSDADYAQLQAHFTQTEIVSLSAAIITINAWNRVAVGFHFLPEFKES